MPIRHVVFDLDGTLIDGYEAIHEALSHAMNQVGVSPLSFEETRLKVGHGLESLMEETVGKELAPQATEFFRLYYPKVVLEKTRLLPGVPELLNQLVASRFRLSMASNKPLEFSKKILESSGVAHYFSAFRGPDSMHPPKPHPAMLQSLMLEQGSSSADTVCVGDMEVDVAFARAGGCRVIVLPGGSRDRKFLETVGADLVIESLQKLPEAVFKLD